MVGEPQAADAEAEIDARWNEIQARVGEPLRQRYRAAQALLLASRSERTPAEAVVAPDSPLFGETPPSSPRSPTTSPRWISPGWRGAMPTTP